MHPLIDRLRRRQIVQWALAYSAGAWVVYQVLQSLAEPWGISNGVLRLVSVILAIGFVVAVTLAWYHGERGEQRVSGVELVILAGILGVGALGLRLVAVGPTTSVSTSLSVERFRMGRLAPNHAVLGDFELGPAGTGITYALRSTGGPKWYRRWDELAGRPIPSSQGGNNYLSPDGLTMAETTRGSELRLISLETGGVRRREMGIWGGALWGGDGYLYFPGPDSTIHRIADSLEGEIEPLGLPRLPGDRMQRFFKPIDGGARAVMWVDADPQRIVGCDMRTRSCRTLAEGTQPRVTSTGHLVYAGPDGRILAARLDVSTLELGATVAVVDGGASFEASGIFQGISWSLSTDGTLGYWEAALRGSHSLVSIGTENDVRPVDPSWSFDAGNPVQYAFSPDRSRIAFKVERGTSRVWVRDLAAGGDLAISDGIRSEDPVWLGDTLVAFVSDASVLAARPDGTGDPRVLVEADGLLREVEVSPDLTRIVVRRDRTLGSGSAPQGADLLLAGISPETAARPLLADPNANERAPSISPDGAWIAYVSDIDGQPRVYVRTFPDVNAGGAVVSAGRGDSPVWSGDGFSIYYVAPEGDSQFLLRAQVAFDPRFRVASTDTLYVFQGEEYAGGRVIPGAIPGQFILARIPDDDRQLVIVKNWFLELERLVPR